MKSIELLKLKRMVAEEVQKRKRIEELLDSEEVREYLKLTETLPVDLKSTNIKDVLYHLLPSFTVTETNDIFVCTSAFEYDNNFGKTDFLMRNLYIDSPLAEHRIYKDIESGETIKASNELIKIGNRPLMSEFEKKHIVLNPYNTSANSNGYDEVKYDFFTTALNYGQEEAKKLVLTKYNRLERY